MSGSAQDADFRSRERQFARLSILAAFLSCSLNCVFSQLVSRAAGSLASYGWLVDWISLAMVVAGVGLGLTGLTGGWRRQSRDTAAIAAIGLALNLGILALVAWYFAVIRPAAGE
jgi:hypothetical protein